MNNDILILLCIVMLTMISARLAYVLRGSNQAIKELQDIVIEMGYKNEFN